MSDKSSIIKEVQKYIASGQIDKAIAEWEKLAKEYPDGATYNTIGDLYLKKGDKTSAVDSFHKAANFFRHEGFSPKALALYKKILNINPTEFEALFSIGELNEEKGLITDAIKYYLATADSLSKGGKKEKLFDIYNKILALSPDDIHLRNKVAEIYSKEGLMSEAAKQYFQIAMLYFGKGDMENSMGYYQKVLDVQPLNKEAILGISYLYERSGNLERAIEQVKEAAKLFPEDTDIHLRGAEIYIMAGRFNEAGDSLRKVLEVEPANIKARRLLGDIYLKEGDRKKAWTEYLPVLDEMILDEKYDDAIKLLESFKDMDPLETGKRLVSLYRQLGEQVQAITECLILNDLYEKAGDIAKSEQIIKEAHEIYPEDPRLAGLLKEEEVAVAPPECPATYVKEKQKEPVVTESEILEAEEITEPVLESDVMDIFNEFKKGLEEELGKEDYETHYNLGIAYKEMGLTDDAIREFQISRDNPKRFIPSSSMLGICYMEKGLYPLAIDVLKNAVDKMKDTGESYWAMKYDLAEAYEKNGNLKEALDLYTEVYEWNSKFRSVDVKINSLRVMVNEEDVGQKKPRSGKNRVSYI